MAGLVTGYFWVMHFLIRVMKKMESLFGIKWFGTEGQSKAANE
jgi:hypothetical protein